MLQRYPDARVDDIRWEALLPQFISLKYWTSRKHQPCPICGGRDRFRLFNDWRETGGAICNRCGAGNGWTWIHRVTGRCYKKVFQAVTERLPNHHSYPSPKTEAPQFRDANALHRLNSILRRGQPVADCTVGLQYLRSRGLGQLIDAADLPPNWRSIPQLPYWDTNEDGQPVQAGLYPALVAPIQRMTGELVSLHRTYLMHCGSGKAPVESPKKISQPIATGAIAGAAIQLYPLAGTQLAIAEGIETALAVRCLLPEIPVWATVSAWGMRVLELPKDVDEVWIMADLDRSETGQVAAYTLANRLRKEGRLVRVRMPPGSFPSNDNSLDWLDHLNARHKESDDE